jgi:hypothetical protein
MFSSSYSSSSSCSSNLSGGLLDRITDFAGKLSAHDKALSMFYFYILILVLILSGNLVQKGKKDKSMGWLAFSICVLLGIIGMVLLFGGKHLKTVGIIIINLIIAALLMFAMIYTDPDAPMTEKIGAHFANIGFWIIATIAVYMTRNEDST